MGGAKFSARLILERGLENTVGRWMHDGWLKKITIIKKMLFKDKGKTSINY